jgi:hypothetical protein
MQMVEHSGLPVPRYIRDTDSDLSVPGKFSTRLGLSAGKHVLQRRSMLFTVTRTFTSG